MKKKIFALIGLALLLQPFAWIAFSLDPKDAGSLVRGWSSARSARIAVVGSSVVDFVSKCDRDRRGIPRILDSIVGRPVADLALPGQSFWEGVSALEATADRTHPRIAVFVFTPVSFAKSYLASRKIVAKGLLLDGAIGHRWEKPWIGLFGDLRTAIDDSMLSYKGRMYGTSKMLGGAIAREENLSSCPEGAATDRSFLEFIHWRSLAKLDPADMDYGLVASELHHLVGRGVKPILVLSPMPKLLFDTLGLASMGPAFQRFSDSLRQAVRNDGIQVVDLSQDPEPGIFAQRWCACGHLNERGRALVAGKIAEAISRESGR